MAIINSNKNVKSTNINKIVPVRFICPICNSQAELKISEDIINHGKQLTTISIPKYKICEHHFQAFVDKNFKVRGYQKVDFEFGDNFLDTNITTNNKFGKNKDGLLKNLIFEGNQVKYIPKDPQNYGGLNMENKEISATKKEDNQEKNAEISEKEEDLLTSKDKEMTLQEIYEEFWEFIDDDNEEFREFIIKDARRSRL